MRSDCQIDELERERERQWSVYLFLSKKRKEIEPIR